MYQIKCNNLFIILISVLLLSACGSGAPKPQELPSGSYVGRGSPSIYDNESSEETISMPYNTSESSANGKVVIYDNHQISPIYERNMVINGTWHTIINGENGLTKPCFTGVVGSVTNDKIGKGWNVAIVNCWLQNDFIPNSLTFQGQVLIWNPISTINYAEFGSSIFLHTENK